MALGEGEIVITIRDASSDFNSPAMQKTGVGASDRVSNFLNPSGDLFGNLSKKQKSYLEHKALDFLKQEALASINQYIGTIGTRTGDYVAQHNAQVSFGIATKGIGLATAGYASSKILAGSALGGPMSALIGVAVAGAATMVGGMFRTLNGERQIRIQNREIALLRQRAGLDINNGSR